MQVTVKECGDLLDAHGSVVAQTKGFDVCAVLPQGSAMAAWIARAGYATY